MTEFSVPTNEDFFAESQRFLETCRLHCRCPNGWHFIWSAYKASGRRRSVYYQQPLLNQLFKPIAPAVNSILIAGAADAGILNVLVSIFGSQVRYVAFDICDAPLREMEHYAEQNHLTIQCIRSALQDFVPQQTFDLIFIHNTLNFLDKTDAVATLRSLKESLSPIGWIACGMRYELGNFGLGGTFARGLQDELRGLIQTTFAERQDLQDLIAPHITAYTDGKMRTDTPRHTPEGFARMIEAAGLVQIGGYVDDKTPAAVASSTAHHSSIRADVYILRPVQQPERDDGG